MQVLDGDAVRSAVPKPCINAQDEGLNCEWSTELTVAQAFAEYVHAHLAIPVLAVELGLRRRRRRPSTPRSATTSTACGAGDRRLHRRAARRVGHRRLPRGHGLARGQPRRLLALRPRAPGAHLPRRCATRSPSRRCTAAPPPRSSGSPSTCSARACTPASSATRRCSGTTSPGAPSTASATPTSPSTTTTSSPTSSTTTPWRCSPGCGASVRPGLGFGVKLSNTLPNDVTRGELPAPEMYLSGRALLPLTLTLAATARPHLRRPPADLVRGGRRRDERRRDPAHRHPAGHRGDDAAQARRLRASAAAGRLATPVMRDFRRSTRMPSTPSSPGCSRTRAPTSGTARRCARARPRSPLGLTDCFTAPCEHGGCPIGQQVPAYLALAAAGAPRTRRSRWWRATTPPRRSPGCSAPSRAGTHCTRVDYDRGVDIRGVKLAAADAAQDELRRNDARRPRWWPACASP